MTSKDTTNGQRATSLSRMACLTDLLRRPVNERFNGQVEISPSCAATALAERNTNNRRYMPAKAKHISRLIENGEFRSDYEPGIKFDWNGVVINGQHTLGGIVAGGVTVVSRVETGCDPKLFTYLDPAGCIRQSHDINVLMGDLGSRTNLVANGIVKAWMRIVDGCSGRCTPHEIHESFRRLETAIRFVVPIAERVSTSGLRAYPVHVAVVEYYRRNSVLAAIFADSLFKVDGDVQQARYLRDYLLRMKPRAGGTASNYVYGCCVAAMRAHMDGREVKTIRRADWINSLPKSDSTTIA